MSDAFVPLAAFLQPLEAGGATEPAVPDPPPEGAAPLAPEPHAETEHVAALAAARRFRAGVADALDAAVRHLLEEVAENVLARELAIAGADIASIVAKTRERFLLEKIIAVRVHPQDRTTLAALEIETIADDSLAPGDLIAELRSGTIDLRLGTRLEIALAACTA